MPRSLRLSVGEISVFLGMNPDPDYQCMERLTISPHKVGRRWQFKVTGVGE